MKRKETLSLGEFRKATENLPDSAVIMIVSEQMNNQALAAHIYPWETTLDHQGVILLEANICESVSFSDC